MIIVFQPEASDMEGIHSNKLLVFLIYLFIYLFIYWVNNFSGISKTHWRPRSVHKHTHTHIYSSAISIIDKQACFQLRTVTYNYLPQAAQYRGHIFYYFFYSAYFLFGEVQKPAHVFASYRYEMPDRCPDDTERSAVLSVHPWFRYRMWIQLQRWPRVAGWPAVEVLGRNHDVERANPCVQK